MTVCSLAARFSLAARLPGPGSLWVFAGETSPLQCGQVSTGSVRLPQVSWTNTTGGPSGRNYVPEVLRDHPKAVSPYLAIRENFAARLYHQHTGYWAPDGRGIAPVTEDERAAALDLLAEGNPERYATAAATLISQGDPELALEIIEPGLRRHPSSAALASLRQAALHRLMERHQQLDPFRFLVYAELAGAEISPVQ